MIRALALGVGALLLAICGPVPADANPPASGPPGSAQSPTAASAGPGEPPSPPPDTLGSALSGRVSGLSGEVSSLEARVGALRGTITEHEIVIPLPSDTLFDFDRAEIRAPAEPGLRQVAQLLAQTDGIAQVDGHTDAKGDDEYNLALSRRRAEAVVEWLVVEGAVPTARLQARGFGERRPVAPNANADGSDNPEGRARNRRVEVVIAR